MHVCYVYLLIDVENRLQRISKGDANRAIKAQVGRSLTPISFRSNQSDHIYEYFTVIFVNHPHMRSL